MRQISPCRDTEPTGIVDLGEKASPRKVAMNAHPETLDDWPDDTKPPKPLTRTEAACALCREHVGKVVKVATYNDQGTATRTAGTFSALAPLKVGPGYEFRASGTDVYGTYLAPRVSVYRDGTESADE
jgi:hypothetical protein